MAKVLVMTDSVACLPADIKDELGIHVVPAANIIFNGQNHIENVTITATEAYQLIEQGPG
jgi:fatty acid-binding protein DegV